MTTPSELQFDLTPDDQALFLAAVDELLQRVEEALVDLERQPDDQVLLQDIFRAAHTIKCSSATIGHTRMAATHAMETCLDDVRKGVAPVTAGLIEALLKALDVLKVLRDEVETRVPAEVDVQHAAPTLAFTLPPCVSSPSREGDSARGARAQTAAVTAAPRTIAAECQRRSVVP